MIVVNVQIQLNQCSTGWCTCMHLLNVCVCLVKPCLTCSNWQGTLQCRMTFPWLGVDAREIGLVHSSSMFPNLETGGRW